MADEPIAEPVTEPVVDPGGTITPPVVDDPVDPPTLDLDAIRQAMAGEDAGFLKQLGRQRSLEDIGKAYKSAITGAQKKQSVPVLGDDASDEDTAAFRKAFGIPDDVKEYPVNFRDGFEASDDDTTKLESFRTKMFEASGDPRTAAAAMGWYEDTLVEVQQELDQRMAEKSTQTQDELRDLYGGEYTGNIRAATEFLKTNLGEDGFAEIMDVRLGDGTKLQDNPHFVKMMVGIGVDYYGANTIVSGDIETTTKTLDEKMATFRKMQTEEPDKYYSDAVQKEVAALYKQKENMAKKK